MSTSVVRVGVDLVCVTDVAASLDRFGDRYVRRLFTDDEVRYCRAVPGRGAAERFAARFAAKEAAFKALRPGTTGLDWRAIEVRSHPTGACELVLHGEAAAVARRQGIRSMAVCLSHEAGYARAVVVAQG